ncbi:ketoacyl-ACP synthase III [Metapseudomonas furukawaii]|nr:ketoacyl-ACP synthase III [Pseudomonas furukawaii]
MSDTKFNLGIQDVAVYIPSTRIDNLAQGSQYETDSDFVLEKIGVRELPRLGEDETVTMACKQAFARLLEKTALDPNEIECIVVCTQTPDMGGIPHTSALVHAAISAPEASACFDIGLGCSGYVYCLQVVTSFMQMHGMRKGLLFTCDPYSRILDANDKNTSLLFGDAATVTLISDAPKFVSKSVKFATRGSAAEALTKKSGNLYMNGRAVFNFALTDVPKQISELIDASGMSKEQIDLFLLHQGSKFMLENTIKRIDGIADRAPVDLELTGNTVSSSIPVLLEKHLGKDGLNTILMSGFGVGLSWASAIYTKPE